MQRFSSLIDSTVTSGFHVLSGPLRIAILELLKERELCVCELSDALGVSGSRLSFHLKTLKDSQLISSRQEGRWIYYSLNLAQFVVLEQYLSQYRRFSELLPARSCQDIPCT